MEISKKQILECASHILDHVYNESNYPQSVCLSTEAILAAVSAISGYKIIKAEVPVPGGRLRGQLLPFENGRIFKDYIISKSLQQRIPLEEIFDDDQVALILLADSNTNNPCWARFTLVKEAAHLVLESDSLGKWSDITKLSLSLTSQKFDSLEGDMAEYLNREQAAEKLAVEIFLCESRMKDWMQHQINVKCKSAYEIAKLLRVPERFVEQEISKWGIKPRPKEI